MTYSIKAITIVFVNLFLLLFPGLGRADSPLTSNDFAEAYLDIPIVNRAKATGRVDAEIATFLTFEG